MHLHYHPVSTTSRPIMLLAAEHALPLQLVSVDLFSGEHQTPAFTALNPNQAVPVLTHGDFRLTESSAILKYLADLHGLDSVYPRSAQARARVDALMDWLNTSLSREFCHGFVYPQLFDKYQRPDGRQQAEALAWARPRARRVLGILDEHLIGPNRSCLLGDRPTLADLMAVAMLTLGEAIGEHYAHWRNIRRFLAAMKARPSFTPTHALFYKLMVGMFASQTFEHL